MSRKPPRKFPKKLPKQIILSGKIYKVKRNPKIEGGQVSTGTHLIELGNNDCQSLKSALLHEILEAILLERCHDYTAPNREKLYILNHGDFTNVVDDLALALKDW